MGEKHSPVQFTMKQKKKSQERNSQKSEILKSRCSSAVTMVTVRIHIRLVCVSVCVCVRERECALYCWSSSCCMRSYEEEDTCVSYEEEDTCVIHIRLLLLE